MRLFEWQSTFFPNSHQQRDDFIGYLSTVWENRNRYQDSVDEPDEEENQEERIQRQRFFDFTTDGLISARNFVGVVQYGDIRIEVYPKIFAGSAKKDAGQWQLNLLYWLSYCRKINFPFSFANIDQLDFDDFLELLIHIFAHYTADIISRQPYQSYQTISEETSFLQGRLNFEDYLKNNLTTGRWQHFYCTYMPFVYDNTFNRIIKYVTRRLAGISRNKQNLEKLSEISFLLDDVSDVRCTAADCDLVKLNPLFMDLQNILQLCRLYLSEQIIHFDMADNKNFCFLVPMEYVFEEFTYGFMLDNWPNKGLTSQSKTHLAICEGQNVFQIKNDIYVKDKLIIDTKYKIRYRGDGLKAGVIQSDLYQMVTYSLRRNCKDVLLLYPKSAGGLNDVAVFSIPSASFDLPINITVNTLDITFTDITEAEQIIKERIRELHPMFK
ncbi:MAG: McrC family protein [Mucilaginibacter sp.]